MDNVTQRVNEYAVLTQQMARLKSRAEELKAYFERLAVADLKDTKLKTVEYLGSEGARVTVSVTCLLYTSPSPRDPKTSRMPSSA